MRMARQGVGRARRILILMRFERILGCAAVGRGHGWVCSAGAEVERLNDVMIQIEA